MFKQGFALYAPEDGDGAAGGGAAGGEAGGEKDVVPKSQFLAAINSATEKMERALAAQRSEFEQRLAAATAPKAEPAKVYTRAELKQLVDAGTISDDQADEVIERQITQRVTVSAVNAARETIHQATTKESVDSQIAQYTALMPEILDDASDIRGKLRKTFKTFTDLGDPKNAVTELKAIIAVCGPLDSLTKAKSGRPSHDSHQETPGDGGGAGPRGGQGNLKLTAREKAHYESKVGPGKLYADWKAVEKELTYANPERRRKHGATA